MLVSGIIVAGIFLCYGIRWLILAYTLTNPHEFLMFFFSASMVILVNAALLLVLLVSAFLKLRAQFSRE